MDLSVATLDPFASCFHCRERSFVTQIWSCFHYSPSYLKTFVGFLLLLIWKQTPLHGLTWSGLHPFLHTHLLLSVTHILEPLWSSSSSTNVLSIRAEHLLFPLLRILTSHDFTWPTALLILQVSESMSLPPGWLFYPLCELESSVYSLIRLSPLPSQLTMQFTISHLCYCCWMSALLCSTRAARGSVCSLLPPQRLS